MTGPEFLGRTLSEAVQGGYHLAREWGYQRKNVRRFLNDFIVVKM